VYVRKNRIVVSISRKSIGFRVEKKFWLDEYDKAVAYEKEMEKSLPPRGKSGPREDTIPKPAIRIRKSKPRKLEMNGCLLTPALDGRCGDYGTCKHFGECNTAISHLNWPGFKAVKKEGKC
jgi:hypothetical protein